MYYSPGSREEIPPDASLGRGRVPTTTQRPTGLQRVLHKQGQQAGGSADLPAQAAERSVLPHHREVTALIGRSKANPET